MKKTLLTGFALAFLGAVLAAGNASATFIDGSIEMGFSFTPVDDSGVETTLDVATGLDFILDIGVVSDVSGDFSGIPLLSQAALNDFQFVGGVPVSPLWTVAGFSFDLTSVIIDEQTTTDLDLKGTGTIFAAGFDATPGVWNFSGQTSNPAAEKTEATFSWSASTSAVPEPTTMLLFGTGLAGLAGISRRRKK